MLKNFLPKIDPHSLCDLIGLCTVRMKDNKPYCGVKQLDWSQHEIPLDEIVLMDTYKDKPIKRTYSSGCVFISDDLCKVFLLTVSKKDNIQHQFTGWSPLETDLQDVYINDQGTIKLHIEKIEDNAILRTYKRTGVEVISLYNDIPLVDRALIENKDDDGQYFWRLVLLMHFVVKEYQGIPAYTWEEYTVGSHRYNIQELHTQKNLAPNVIIITHKAIDIIRNHQERRN